MKFLEVKVFGFTDIFCFVVVMNLMAYQVHDRWEGGGAVDHEHTYITPRFRLKIKT